MNPGDGQRRVDAKDGYAPFEVRSAFRRDPNPEPHLGWWCLGAAAVILAAFVAVHFVLPTVNTIVPDVMTFPLDLLT